MARKTNNPPNETDVSNDKFKYPALGGYSMLSRNKCRTIFSLAG